MIVLNYKEAVDYIEETPKFTTKNSLDHTKECLRRLGNPQEKFRVIHVAGTNGKGSVCAFLASMLREGGYRCGLFTSPHLVKINERFQMDEIMVDDETFLNAFLKVKKLADDLVAEGSYHPTYSEIRSTSIRSFFAASINFSVFVNAWISKGTDFFWLMYCIKLQAYSASRSQIANIRFFNTHLLHKESRPSKQES